MFSAVLLHLHTLKQTLCHCHMSQAAQRLLHESVDILYMVCSADLHLVVICSRKKGRQDLQSYTVSFYCAQFACQGITTTALCIRLCTTSGNAGADAAESGLPARALAAD